MDNARIEKAAGDQLLISIRNQTWTISPELSKLKEILGQEKVVILQYADKIYNIDHITNANFSPVVDRLNIPAKLSTEKVDQLLSEQIPWAENLKRYLVRQGVNMKRNPTTNEVFQHYGWLIETFLRKMSTPPGEVVGPRRMAFMAEAYQSSLRYLCYIQLAQLMSQNTTKISTELFKLSPAVYQKFDFLALLIACTEEIPESDQFMPELHAFVEELTNRDAELYRISLYLDQYRSALIAGNLPEGKALEALLNDYLKKLVKWLCRISFIAKYRLVSIKDINLNYRLGTAKTFEHIYGELHGMYDELSTPEGELIEIGVKEAFTYNHSILLLEGDDLKQCLINARDRTAFISLSPLIIDRSVFSKDPKQTPEIYFFAGKIPEGYAFEYYKNELQFAKGVPPKANKTMEVESTNFGVPSLDELYEQIQQLLEPQNLIAG